ncbi:hypothetical protein [Microbulbifer sp. SSSA005]|uniref:hypothetical protein n=1 Tax=Microbulbifer sp. SSSA005 TaxID=3243378 RepID=UPI00403A5E15
MADVLSGIVHMLNISSRLRDIAKNIEDAEIKNLVADLSLELSDFKLKVSDLMVENAELKDEVHKLKSADGVKCPKCANNTFEIISTKPHPQMGKLGIHIRTHLCSVCEFKEDKTVET